MINKDTKEITFTVDTKKNRYYFGFGFLYVFYTRIKKTNINDYSYFFIGKELLK